VEKTNGDHELRRAYALCRRMQLRHDPTFFAATQRLPREIRPAVHAVYGYVRTADELVDGGRRTPDPKAALDRWERELDHARATGETDQPVIAALVDAAGRHDLPLDELKIYMRSMRVDCSGRVRIASANELDRYMDGSAAAVGRIMAPLLGSDDPEGIGRLGVAFQLTNFIRDIREDFAMDRVYLPGLPEDELRSGHAGDGVREAVAGHVARARSLFNDTAGTPEACLPAVRSGMRLARAVYERVLVRVEQSGFDPVGGRAALRPWEVAVTALRS
jgi:phytoene synthase